MEQNRIDNYYIVGTDTGVGKTVFSMLMMQYFFRKGYVPFYLKPFQTGCKNVYDTDSDAKFVYEHTNELKNKDPKKSVIYCYKNPKAPYFAARDEDKKISINKFFDVVNEKEKVYNPMVIEAAGGLFVPISDKIMVIDTIKKTGAKPVLVARAGLGTINHTLLSVDALFKRNIEPAGIIFIDKETDPTSDEMINDNIEAVNRYSGLSVNGVIKKITDFSNPSESYYNLIDSIVN